MNDDQIADLKQFMATTISQQMSGFATKDDLQNLATKDDLQNLATQDDLARVEQKIDDIQAAIGEALSDSNEATDTQLTDHEQRITTLEKHFA